MPHLAVHALEDQLAGREQPLISALTDAVVAVYGEWAREIVVIELIGLPPVRWGVGGSTAADSLAPRIDFGIRYGALNGTEGAERAERLATQVTDAVAGVIGQELRSKILVEFHQQPVEHTAVGGRLVSNT